MRKFLLFLAFLLPCEAFAGEYHLLNMEHFDMSYADFRHQRDPYAMEYTDDWLYRAATNFRFNFMGALYWDNYVHMEAVDGGTPKTVGWHWTLGLRLHDNLDVFAEHHSRHVMEDERPRIDGHNQFPVEDSYGIRFTVIEDSSSKRSVWRSIFGR
jgi:hypothetical protein